VFVVLSVGSNYGVMGQYETSENGYDQPLHHLFEQNGQTGVNFINILLANFSYKHRLGISLVTCT